jgi:hypothetical protein
MDTVKRVYDNFVKKKYDFDQLNENQQNVLSAYWQWQYESPSVSPNDPMIKAATKYDETYLKLKEQVLDAFRTR